MNSDRMEFLENYAKSLFSNGNKVVAEEEAPF